MLFKPKFFLDLGAESQQQPTPVAPIVAPPAATAEPDQTAAVSSAALSGAAVSAPATAAAPGPSVAGTVAGGGASLTTAEAIAAELAAAQANRPAPSLATFAPACVTPGGALPRRRRRGGADLAGFRELAKGMLSS